MLTFRSKKTGIHILGPSCLGPSAWMASWAIQVTRLGPTIPSSGTFAGSNILTPTGPQKANSHTEDVGSKSCYRARSNHIVGMTGVSNHIRNA